MNRPDDHTNRQRLRAHFGFRVAPFNKATRATAMFASQAQTALVDGLMLWTEVRGLSLVTGPPGVGKSITLRRFALELPRDRFEVIGFSYLPTTPAGLGTGPGWTSTSSWPTGAGSRACARPDCGSTR